MRRWLKIMVFRIVPFITLYLRLSQFCKVEHHFSTTNKARNKNTGRYYHTREGDSGYPCSCRYLCIRGSSGLANTAFTMDRVWRLYLKGPLTFVTFLKIICFRLWKKERFLLVGNIPNWNSPAFHIFFKFGRICLFEFFITDSITKKDIVVIHKNIRHFLNQMSS